MRIFLKLSDVNKWGGLPFRRVNRFISDEAATKKHHYLTPQTCFSAALGKMILRLNAGLNDTDGIFFFAIGAY